jgi:kynurenine formamidase
MEFFFKSDSKRYSANLSNPIDISIPLRAGHNNVNAWYCSPVKIEPVMSGDWVGDVSKGGAVNFRNISFNPHGNGTHTECVGHISKEWISLYNELDCFLFVAELISINPVEFNGDHVIDARALSNVVTSKDIGALIIRTLPNDDEKMVRQYSNTNPPYLTSDAAQWLVNRGIKHLLIDLPSVDREYDQGVLAAHHIFWNYPQNPRKGATITEMIYVHNEIPDGIYMLNLMVTSLDNDASPSRPVIYSVKELGA